MKPKFYILDKDNHVVETDLAGWADSQVEVQSKRVDYTDISPDIYVSTVFLGLDHNWRQDGLPILFETMIFGGTLDGYQDRYSSWDDAATGHKMAVKKAQLELTKAEDKSHVEQGA